MGDFSPPPTAGRSVWVTANQARHRILLAVLTCSGWLCPVLQAGDPYRHVQVAWTNATLASVMQRESDAPYSWFRDRRVDPRTPLLHSGSGTLLSQINLALAPHHYQAVTAGKLVYLAPSTACAALPGHLRQTRAQLASLPLREKRPFLKQDALTWPRRTNPGEMIASLLTARGLQLEEAALIPYDQWEAGRLPAMRFADQLSVLLYGFNLSWQYVPNTRTVIVSSSKPSGGRQASISAAAVRPTKGPAPALESKRLTLTVQHKPAGTVLQSLASPLGLALHLPPTDTHWQRPISVTFTEATLDEALQAIANQAGLGIRRVGTDVWVESKPSK